MKRAIPDLHKYSLLDLVFGKNEQRSEENYLLHMSRLEKICENHLLDLFKKLDLRASVKTDSYSLPFQKEIEHTAAATSYLNEAFDFRPVARHVLKELLNDGADKFRFYLFINIVPFYRDLSGILLVMGKEPGDFNVDFGAVQYSFRYFVHERI